ncbi:MAG: LytR family transcriptional regulator, partial [Lachnospiraceae bacterium]|nr:LytR family transcriptional regulator [Lachnospiraceae bacterium]
VINKIVDTVFSEIATSLTMPEILSLLSDIASYEVGETAGFPFSDHVKMNGVVGKASVVVPVDLTKNVTLLHEFLFDETDYTPTNTVKQCSQKIASDTGISYNGE